MGNPRILIVEDEAIVAFDLKKILEKIGYDVPCIAVSFEEIISCLEKTEIDLILMDIYLSEEKDGIDVVKYLNSEYQLPVIYITGHSDMDTFRRAKSTNPFGFIVKPFNERDLKLNIEIALNSYYVQKDIKKSEFVKTRILESISEFVLYISSEYKIKWFNAFVEEMCKSRIGKFNDAKCYELVFKRDIPCEECPMEEILKYNDIFSKRRQFDGESIWEITATPIHYEEKVLGIVEIGNNITEKVKYENKLISEKKNAEVANKIKDHFLANVSHELRTPLNGINLALKLMNRDCFSQEDKEYLNIIEVSSKRLLEVIEEILDTTVIENNKMKYYEQVFSFEEIIEFIRVQFENAMKKKNLQFIICEDFSSEKIYSDRKKITQILTNLVENSLKFTETGFVKICAKEIITDGCHELQMEVSDSGPGIPENKRDLIFDKFRQLNDSYTRPYEGLGLGLSIVKEYVGFLKGKLELQSEVGKGSAFKITIPVKTN